MGCTACPADVNVRFSKYAMKLKNRGGIPKKRTLLGHTIRTNTLTVWEINEHDTTHVAGQSSQGQASRTPSGATGLDRDASSQRPSNKTLHAAFDK